MIDKNPSEAIESNVDKQIVSALKSMRSTLDPEAEAILKMTAEKKGCTVADLQWKRDKYGNIHVRKRILKERAQNEV